MSEKKKKITFLQDNNPKHNPSTKKCLQKKKIKVLEWPSKSLDLNPIKNMWIDLVRAVHSRSPHSLIDLEHFFKEEWHKFDK